MTWNVIWLVDPENPLSCIERDWFNEIMSGVPISSVRVDREPQRSPDAARPYSIVCASCPNQISAADLTLYLKQLPKPSVLYHMSDEYVRVRRDVYENCELVIRNGSACFEMAGGANFIQVPLGYAAGLGNAPRKVRKSSDRKCSFAFMGTIKNDRESEMLPALHAIRGPHFVRRCASFEAATRYFGRSTITIYNNAVFVPNPKVNWNPECNRLYDALEWGCIPLIKRYADSEYHRDYHDRLLGEHPIPTFNEWNEAADFANRLLGDAAALDALQARIAGWWHNHKFELQHRLASRLADLRP
jgi:hypothetical protein